MANSSYLNETFVNDNDCCDNNNSNIDDLLLAWHNLRVESRRWWFSSKSVILRRLSGSLGYHELLGVLGPSGSGKSTLLRCLNGTIGSAISSDSQIYLNRSQNRYPVIAFLEQHIHQIIVPHMTVREILYYAFRFKNHGKTKFLEEHMHNTIDELLLDRAILSRPFGKCSGGEQKRVAIAQELMSLVKPSLMLLDEPTTGLDSNSALVVMQTLKHLSQHYRMGIVLTIHQPNDDMLNLFDQLYILAMGGVCIYSGHPSLLQCNLEHFTNFKISDADEKPPIEEYLRIACRGVENNQVCCMTNETQASQQRHLWPRITQLDHLPHGIVNRVRKFHPLDFALHLSRLTRITFIHERGTFLVQIGIIALWYLSMACLFDHQMLHGSRCFSWTDTDTVNATCEATIQDENHIQHYNVYQVFVVLFLGLMTMCTSAMFFVPILKVFRNEHQNRWYSMGTFFWSFTVVKFLELVIFSLVVTVLVYFPTDHPQVDNGHINWTRLSHFASFYLLLAVYLQSIGQLLGVIFIDYIELAIIVGQLTYASMVLINGLSMVVETAGNPLILTIANIVGTNHISKAILYTFYGLDRCDRQDKFSLAFLQSWINPKLVYINLASVLSNVAVLRLSTLIAMYLKFSRVNNSNQMIAPMSGEALPIDYVDKSTFEHAQIVVEIKQIDACDLPDKDDHAKKNVIVAWRDLTLFGSTSWLWTTPPSWHKPRDAILNSLNGEFYSKTLNAVMGSSGAGKTSLLKVLNGRMKNQLDPESRIYLSRHTPVITCFVTQDVTEHLWPGLTVRQLLVYASRLKNVSSCSNQIDHDKIADQLLDDLMLGSAADIPIQHCSGGEMKRLALGLELTSLKMSSLVFIDEPTSGLDSNSAEVVVSCLKKVVNRHSIVIVASIHQPNTEVLMMFDQIYVLARGGVCIYSGQPNAIRKYLSQNRSDQSSSFRYPIEELVKLSCFNRKNKTVRKLVKVTQSLRINLDLMNQEIRLVDRIPLNRVRFDPRSIWILLSRYVAYTRSYQWLHWVIFTAVYVSYAGTMLFIYDPKIAKHSGCISFDDDFSQTCNRSSAIVFEEGQLINSYRYNFYFSSTFLFVTLLQSTLMFLKESTFFLNEHRNGWYSTGSFYLAKTIVEIIPMLGVTLLYTYMVDIYEEVRPNIYYWLVGLMIIAMVAIQGLGHLLALLTRGNLTLSLLVAVSTGIFMMLLGFNSVSSMPYVYQLLASLSVTRFIGNATLILIYGIGRCAPRELQVVLYKLDIENDDSFYYCLKMLLFNLVFYRVIAIFMLIRKTKLK